MTHHTPLCEFYKSMGHDVNNCRSLQFMKDHIHDVFRVQEGKNDGESGGVERGVYQGGPQGGYGCGCGLGNGGGGGRTPTFFNHGEILHVSRFCDKPYALCGYCYNLEHVTKDFPKLLKKWEKKKTHCNMMTVEPCGNNKNDGEAVF
jgi:hypothetical protein